MQRPTTRRSFESAPPGALRCSRELLNQRTLLQVLPDERSGEQAGGCQPS